jgi:nucleotide-binding universal stress UspA family protein
MAILEESEAFGADLIVVGSHGSYWARLPSLSLHMQTVRS